MFIAAIFINMVAIVQPMMFICLLDMHPLEEIAEERELEQQMIRDGMFDEFANENDQFSSDDDAWEQADAKNQRIIAKYKRQQAEWGGGGDYGGGAAAEWGYGDGGYGATYDDGRY